MVCACCLNASGMFLRIRKRSEELFIQPFMEPAFIQVLLLFLLFLSIHSFIRLSVLPLIYPQFKKFQLCLHSFFSLLILFLIYWLIHPFIPSSFHPFHHSFICSFFFKPSIHNSSIIALVNFFTFTHSYTHSQNPSHSTHPFNLI